VVAGPLANFILAIVIFASIFMIYGTPSATPRVDTISANSAAEKAGFKAGDIIASIDDRQIQTFDQVQKIVSTSAGKTLRIAVNRGGEQTVLTVTPEVVEAEGPAGKHRRPVLGISRVSSADEPGIEKVDPLTAVGLGAEKTWFVIETTLNYLGKVVTGRESPDQISGVIGIAQVSGQVANFGFFPILDLAGMLSVSIGLLNLFPIPLLDGGHLLFYGIEALRGRPLSERSQEMGFRFGLAVVLFLMIFATYNDVSRLPWLRWLWS